MNKIVSFLKKLSKLVLWAIASLIFLFVLLFILIQIPVIQNKLVSYATSFLSDKTNTRIEIKNISIAFPKSIVIEGIYLEDLKKDTLLYAEKVSVNISFFELLDHKVTIKSFALENVEAHINRTRTDSLFNYNFLLTAFSDSTKKTIEPKTKSKWTVSVDKISLDKIHLQYNDNYGGTNLAATLEHLKLNMEKIDLARSVFSIDELSVEHLTAALLIKESKTPTEEKTSDNMLPMITANKIQIIESSFNFKDSVNMQSVLAGINKLTLKDGKANLEGQVISLDDLHLSNSRIRYERNDSLRIDTVLIRQKISPQTDDWKIAVKNIELEENSLAYHVVNQPALKYTFDAQHLDYQHLILRAKQFFHSNAKTEVTVKELSATDQNNFRLEKFETDFLMDQHSISVKKLKSKTTNSTINADLSIHYTSLNALKDSVQFMVIEADMKNVKVQNSDILYFVPQLSKQPFFTNTQNVTRISGKITGPLNTLKGATMVVQTGSSTVLKTNFTISGLPAAKTAFFNFPDLKIVSGKKDLVMLLGPLLPKSIELPEIISMQIVYKGQLKAFETTAGISSSFGAARISAAIDKNENFRSKAVVTNFDLGLLLRNKKMFGPVTLTAETNGKGLNKKTIQAEVLLDASEFYLNKYTYHDLKVDGSIHGQQFEGKINLNDKNAVFAFDGLVNLNPDEEAYKFRFDLEAADLKKLYLTEDDIQIGLMAVSDLKGSSVNEVNGKAGITKIIVVHGGKKYILDSVLVASINQKSKSELNVASALVGIKYSGTFSPAYLGKELSKFANRYFTFSDTTLDDKKSEAQNFSFEVQLHNHPILSEVFVPNLKEFEPGLITGSFNSELSALKLTATMRKIVYGSTEVRDFALDVNSDSTALDYKVFCRNVSNSNLRLENFTLDGKLTDKSIFANLSSIDEKQNKKILVRSKMVRNNNIYKLTLDPKEFYLMNDRWDIAEDNYIEFGKQGFLVHHLFMNKAESQINVASVNDKFNDDLNIAIHNFQLADISRIIEKDTSLAKGTVEGNILMKRVNNAYGLIADAKISDLYVREVPVGTLVIKANNPTAEKFDLDLSLTGEDNNFSAKGYFIPKGGDNSININGEIGSLSLKTAEAFSMGAITNASGMASGNFLVSGNAASPDITGELVFNNVLLTPAYLNNQLELKKETVQLKKDGLYFNSFTILDPGQHPAVINGNIKMTQFKNLVFALNVNTKDFLLFNTTAKDNKEFYGRMVIDSRIDFDGPMTSPIINAKLKMKKGSNFTFAIPEKQLNTYKGEDVVEFDDSLKLNPILTKNDGKQNQKTKLTGFEISSVIEIDKQATLRLLMDPTSTDSLVVKGEAALSFAIDRSGKMSLTGAYNVNDGSYLVSLESIMKRKFDIDPGSTIIWNGDPLNADIVINATYSLRAAPIDLVADQLSGMTEADQAGYKQRYPFLVLLKLRGELSHPEISFEIQLPPNEKGILGGAVNAKLNMLNEDPSALNKQVFALLVLGRFVQENPLQTETNAASAVARTTVGKFLSAQLNQLSSKAVPGVELNFDVQSYDEYTTGQEEGRTEVDISVKKQLFNERLSVQVGGSVDVEGEKAKQNSASDITSDVTLEYKLTKDARYRLKGFRHNQYGGAIEGQLVETGAGVLYVRDFNKWKELFHKRIKIDKPKTTITNDTINTK